MRHLQQSVTVKAPRDAVRHARTTSEGARAFFAAACLVELRMGGACEILFDTAAPPGERGSEGMRVRSFVPGRRRSFEGNNPPVDGAAPFPPGR